MLVEFRAAVAALVKPLTSEHPIEVLDRIPEDVNLLPCIVVGMPSASPSSEAGVVFDRTCVLYVIGRKVDAGDPEGELVALADVVFTTLGGSRGLRSVDGAQHLIIEAVASRVVQVAGLDHDAYLLTISSPVATC